MGIRWGRGLLVCGGGYRGCVCYHRMLRKWPASCLPLPTLPVCPPTAAPHAVCCLPPPPPPVVKRGQVPSLHRGCGRAAPPNPARHARRRHQQPCTCGWLLRLAGCWSDAAEQRVCAGATHCCWGLRMQVPDPFPVCTLAPPSRTCLPLGLAAPPLHFSLCSSPPSCNSPCWTTPLTLACASGASPAPPTLPLWRSSSRRCARGAHMCCCRCRPGGGRADGVAAHGQPGPALLRSSAPILRAAVLGGRPDRADPTP